MEVQLKDLPILEFKMVSLHTQSKYMWLLALTFRNFGRKIQFGGI